MSETEDKIEASVDVAASCERVFEIYTAVADWPQWDPDLEAAGIDGAFKVGARGWIKPRGAPRLKTRLIDVQPGRSFTAESKVPGCILRFHHELSAIESDEADAGAAADKSGSSASSSSESSSAATRPLTRVVHTVDFEGMGSSLIKKVVGPRIRDAFPGAMSGLKKAAESEKSD